MKNFLRILPFAAAAALASPISAQTAAPTPGRAIRRTIPITNAIRYAMKAGTRDSSGRPGSKYWQMRTDYTISTRLDVPRSTVSGRERVIIRNNSDSVLSSVVLRLDQNLFRGTIVRASAVQEVTAGLELTKLVLNGETIDLASSVTAPIPGSTRRTPSIADVIKGTSAKFNLATPIPAKGTGTMEAEWNFRVPLYPSGARGDRLGRWGDSLYQVAQWYPRLAVYDDLRGWDTEPYLNGSEFYNNFGSFDVTIDVPGGWLVGATGVLQNPADVLTPSAREKLAHLRPDSSMNIVSATERGPGKSTAFGDRLVWHFVADSVADFAWGASSNFVWDADLAVIPGRPPVPVHFFYLPGNAQRYATGVSLATHALEFYSKLWMPYAFPQLTAVDGPENGMEYPMFIMSSSGAADHEAGHQWWPMTVGVNETWYPFMDEGFNNFMNALSRADRDHKKASLDSLGQSYGKFSGDEREAPLMWNANYGGPKYSFQAYSKAGMMLSMLGGIVGDSVMLGAMSEYAKTWSFKHPSPWDYAFFMSNALHRDLGWLWYYWLFTTESVDGSIQNVVTRGNRTIVTVRQDGEMPSPVVLKVDLSGKRVAQKLPANVRMLGDSAALVTYPVDVWFSGKRTFDAVLDFGGRKISKITLDPGKRFPDRDPSDNEWPRAMPTVR
ncbi:MAG: M1 family metallopeptidase [Gemmatimonadaceae bacterium]|nr:M1 family metallopeptidase [Gemmatimonadaceae bacterium]